MSEMRRLMRIGAEAILALICALCLIATAINPEWIEAVFGLDPDEGSGALEWGIVLALAVVTLASSAIAGRDWKRLREAREW